MRGLDGGGDQKLGLLSSCAHVACRVRKYSDVIQQSKVPLLGCFGV